MKQNKSVLVGLSGGVDSSVAALLLKKRGFHVIGAYMKTFRELAPRKNNRCKSISEMTDEKMAEKMARLLGIKLIKLDYRKQYNNRVVKPMIRAYSRGLTPNPDIVCNKLIKFPYLWKEALKLKADFIATGHYARIKKSPNSYQLLSASDKTKDQSYFLYELSQNDLSHTLFPIGTLTKAQVRKIAQKHHFLNWNKPGTRGICFIGKINFKSFLEKKIPNRQGRVITPEGQVIGTHPGSFYFTIGQRVGAHLGFQINPKASQFSNKKLYVAEKLKNNAIIVAPENHPLLKKSKIIISSLHQINPKDKIPASLSARIRHLGEFHKGKLAKKGSRYIFTFSKPVKAIAEGQSLVLYNKNQVVAGGEIRFR
jgi:tRNA-specific 2-thiouridylase